MTPKNPVITRRAWSLVDKHAAQKEIYQIMEMLATKYMYHSIDAATIYSMVHDWECELKSLVMRGCIPSNLWKASEFDVDPSKRDLTNPDSLSLPMPEKLREWLVIR